MVGEIDVNQLSRADVLALRGRMVASRLSVACQYSVLTVLKGMLRFSAEILKRPSLGPAEIRLPSRQAPNVTVLTPEEMEYLFSHINVNAFTGLRLRALIEVLLASGMRISEALSLDRLLFDSGATQTEIIGKGNKQRTVFFTNRCQHWVSQYLRRRVDDNPALFVTTGFPARRLRREDVSRFFVNVRAAAGIDKRVSPHIFRHTYCSTLLANGADITFIKELAGHQFPEVFLFVLILILALTPLK